jgi:hypothetical protein
MVLRAISQEGTAVVEFDLVFGGLFAIAIGVI